MLDDDTKREAEGLLKMKVNKKQLQQHLSMTSQKVVTLKVLSAEFYFHKPITVHLELYLFYCFIHFLLFVGQY